MAIIEVKDITELRNYYNPPRPFIYMGIEEFRSDRSRKGGKTKGSTSRHTTRKGSSNYEESRVIDILKKANEETEGNKLSRSKYKSWRDNNLDGFNSGIPSQSWFYRHGTWNEWLDKANIQKNRKGTEIDVNTDSVSFSKAYLIGCCLGDGSIIMDKGQKGIKLSSVDKSFTDRFSEAIKEAYNLEKDSVTRTTYNPDSLQSNIQYEATKRSKQIAKDLNQYKLQNWNSWVQIFNKEQLTSLLQGMWDSECYSSEIKRTTFSTTEPEMKNLVLKTIFTIFDTEIELKNVNRCSINYGNISVEEVIREESIVNGYNCKIKINSSFYNKFTEKIDVRK